MLGAGAYFELSCIFSMILSRLKEGGAAHRPALAGDQVPLGAAAAAGGGAGAKVFQKPIEIETLRN